MSLSENDNEHDLDESNDHLETDAAGSSPGAQATGQRLSAGERLAAEKEAKAKAKAEKRAERLAQEQANSAAQLGETPLPPIDSVDELRSTAVGQTVLEVGAFADRNRKMLLGVSAAAVVAVVGVIGFSFWSQKSKADAGKSLLDAIAVTNARVGGSAADTAEGERHFETGAARAEAMKTAFQAVAAQQSNGLLGSVALLGEASALVSENKLDEALQKYETVLAGSSRDGFVTLRALEGKGLIQLSKHEFAGAIETFERIARIGDGTYRSVSEYYVAHTKLVRRTGQDETEAKAKLRELVETLRGEAGATLPNIRMLAENELRELDPSAVPQSPAGAGGGMDSEQIQQLIRQMQSQGGMPQ